VAESEGHGDPGRSGEAPRPALAPGALSALLQQLAEIPEERPAAPAPQPGTVIGRFELVRKIGAGAFGDVYEARDQQLHRSVAFKLVRPGRLEAGEDQLGREAEIVAQLSHPNLVTLFDVGRCDHGPYLVLELLRGTSLHERHKGAPLPLAEAVRVATEIARGLAYAHGHGVVHRDLKPSNVFLCDDGRVKLLDFGMARAFGRRHVSGGTPAYMAPEQWREAPEDERTDVYALGVMLFEMLTGVLPFPGDVHGDATRSSRRAPSLDLPGAGALAELVGRMLEKDPTARPRDGGEVLRALSAVEGDLRSLPGEPRAALGPPRVRRRGRARALAVAAVLVALVAVAAIALWRWPRGMPASPRARAIVVLPFANVSDSPENEYFSDGLTEEILEVLTRLRELRVAARTSSFYFKNKKVEIADVAQRLGVDVVLEGSVRRDRDRLRISAELVDARSGFRIWGQTYDRRLEDVFAIQQDIARQVVGGLEIVLSKASEGELRKPRAESLAAYDLYLKGRAQLRLPTSAESLDRAKAYLEQAIAADPGMAQAYAALCETWLASYENSHAAESYEQAEGACARALSRDREAGEVYVALGNLHRASGRYPQAEKEFAQGATLASGSVDAVLGLARTYEAERRPADAEATFQKAAKLDPGYWRVHQLRGNFLFQSGRYLEAARSYAAVLERTPDNAIARSNLGAAYYMAGDLEKAVEAWRASLALAPTTFAYSNIGTSYFYLGRLDEAAAMYLKALELAPDDRQLWGHLGDALAYAPGRERDAAAAYEKAVAFGERALRINPSDAELDADLAHYHASLGHRDRARQLLSDALKQDPRNPRVQYDAALVHARLREKDAALAALEQAVELGYQRELLRMDAGLASLAGEARFQALLGAPNR
jgi:eukaryotic-like serine/threonine-protein kinase